ncbi:MAG: type IV-A pilus assembly ATPase PilB [Legionellales bacterium]|nr:type IV-A pilus assembly ATPase PilB [Legionellales bacterium]
MPGKGALSGLAAKCVEFGLLSKTQALAAVREASVAKMPFVEYLLEHTEVDDIKLAASSMTAFNLPLLDIDAFDLTQIDMSILNLGLIEAHFVLPLGKRGKKCYIAMADPSNVQALDDVKYTFGLSAEPILVRASALKRAIKSAHKLSDNVLDLTGIDLSKANLLHDKDHSLNIEDAPVVKFVDKILRDAIKKGASDIHFEPYEHTFRIRIRRDGVLSELASTESGLGPRIIARLKVLSQLNLSERRVPQDGRFKIAIANDGAIDFRISTCPTLFGEKTVVRILDPTSAQMGIDALGYEPAQKDLFLQAINKPQGMVLVTGPTGSGKTVSLYTALNILNTMEVNISTAEDPVEINLAGVNQVNVNSRVGLTFATALKAFLRQDPDIVMVGEIRDLETAETAVKAAQTGHLVLSTLHTNSAPETIVRLMNMGIPTYNLATALSLVIAQRLARRLCQACRHPVDVPKQALLDAGYNDDELDTVQLYQPIGCDECSEGYKGRVGLYEVMPITSEISKIIMGGGNAIDLAKQARAEGVINLHRAGLNKVKSGLTTLDEVLRVTKA